MHKPPLKGRDLNFWNDFAAVVCIACAYVEMILPPTTN